MSKVSNRVLYVVSLNHATNDGSVYLLSSLFPVVLSLFDISVLQVGIIVSLGYLVNVLFQPVIGHYGEGRDPARLLALGIALITISIISFIFATGFLSLLASVVLLRLGSSFFHPVGISTVSRTYDGPALQKAMGFQSAFGNLGVLLTFLTAAPLYLLVGWRSTFLVFAIWTMMDILLTLTVLRSRISRESSNPLAESQESSSPRIPLFFAVAAFISGGTYAVILNFANIFLGAEAHLGVSQANLIVSSFIALAFIGALATGGWRRFLPTNVVLAISYLVAFVTIAAFTLVAGNVILGTVALLANGFAISSTYPLTYTELSRYLAAMNQKAGRSFGLLSSSQTIGASILGLVSGYISQFLGLGVAFGVVAGLTLLGSVATFLWIRGGNRRGYKPISDKRYRTRFVGTQALGWNETRMAETMDPLNRRTLPEERG